MKRDGEESHDSIDASYKMMATRRTIGLYRENTIAIESEAIDSLSYRSKRICTYET